jgi:hypothetical protein
MQKQREFEGSRNVDDDIDIEFLEKIRADSLKSEKTAQEFQKLFKKLNIDIFKFWKKGRTLAATAEGWVIVDIDIIKKLKQKGRDRVMPRDPACPNCGKRSVYFRQNSNTWICYNCKSVFPKNKIVNMPKKSIQRW